MYSSFSQFMFGKSCKSPKTLETNHGIVPYGGSRDRRLQANNPVEAQKLLDDLLEKNIEMMRTHIPANDNHQSDGGVIRLFRKVPAGMRLNPIVQYPGPQKKAKIIPGEEIDEKSRKFRRRIQSVAINGSDIVAAVRQACQRSLARWEAKDTAAKAAAKHEEERLPN